MLTRWDPWREMSRLSDELFRGYGAAPAAMLRPPVDIYEEEHAIRVTAELPGVRPGDVHIEVEDNVLTVSGERKLENEQKQENYHRVERVYGSFSRSFVLPRTVDASSIDAQMKDGLLVITLPKRAEAQARRIAVRTEGEETGQILGSGGEKKSRESGEKPSAHA